ncbi:MAG: TetR family transcriptional regulator [Rhizobiales bacterium PAR1]|nr:MAG: TetR family transcriptional regulator [Rhizobiales bacterium PAR1]
MRITKGKKQENHDRIVTIASEMFRERGFDGVGVADLMERAGLTHGGFYNHFASKEALIAEASIKGFIETSTRYADHDVGDVIDAYISRAHRDARGLGCPAAALSGEAARLPEAARSVFGEGIAGLVAALESRLVANQAVGKDARAQAINLLAKAVGAVVLSRACPDTSALADEILNACRADCHAVLESSK